MQENQSTDQKVDESTITWLDKINEDVQNKANELSGILNCIIEPCVFVIEEGKDFAVAYLKKPDAKQSLKLFRLIADDFEGGLEMAARSQLVREITGTDNSKIQVSDPRFMDVNGKYDLQYSELNVSLLLRMKKIISLFSDEFKKK